VDKRPDAVRQIAHRARQHVAARRPRQAVSASEARPVLEAGRRALETGDLQGLLDILAPDVVLITDGGGRIRAALHPITGAEKVVRFAFGGISKAGLAVTAEHCLINGSPALLLRVDGELDGVVAFRMAAGKVTGLYFVRNPEKLTRIGSETQLAFH
jgi:hypothetical protein